MTAAACDLIGFCHDFELRIARHREHLPEPCLLTDMREAACHGDVRRVANCMREIERLIRRERLWRLESLAAARGIADPRYAALEQRLRNLAYELPDLHEEYRRQDFNNQAIFREYTGRTAPPASWLVCGRRSGKSGEV